MSMKFIYPFVAAYRNYSTKNTNQTTRWGQGSIKNRNKTNWNKHARTKIKWTDQQERILDAISRGESVFLTGSAGSGKTVLVNHIVKMLKKIHGRSRVFVTASTGVAACALNGQTLHSFAGIRSGEVDAEALLQRVLSDKRAFQRWSKAKALVIDEISLVDANLFDKLQYIAAQIQWGWMGRERKWGEIQLVVSGDFFQLPPIIDQHNSSGREFAFEADCWDSSFHLQVELDSVFRQSEAQLIKLLQGIRKGDFDRDDLRILNQRCSVAEPDPSVVRLYPRNQDVNRVNIERLKSLEKKTVVYTALDSGDYPWKNQLTQGLAPQNLEVCEGARVMLVKNIDCKRKLANGATGTIIDFCEPREGDLDLSDSCLLPVVKFDSGMVMVIEPETWVVMEGDTTRATRTQIPLVLAWALSIHKCQGMTLDSLHTDLSKAFGYGMVYVALSRIKSLEGLHLSGFCPWRIKAHPKVLKYYQYLACRKSYISKKDRDDESSER